MYLIISKSIFLRPFIGQDTKVMELKIKRAERHDRLLVGI